MHDPSLPNIITGHLVDLRAKQISLVAWLGALPVFFGLNGHIQPEQSNHHAFPFHQFCNVCLWKGYHALKTCDLVQSVIWCGGLGVKSEVRVVAD